jgi:hypothetical protein
MFRLFDLIAAMVRHHPVHSAAIADRPKRLVDVTRLPLREIQRTRSGLSIGALATNTKTANHPLVRENYPPFAMVFLGPLRIKSCGVRRLLQTGC